MMVALIFAMIALGWLAVWYRTASEDRAALRVRVRHEDKR